MVSIHYWYQSALHLVTSSVLTKEVLKVDPDQGLSDVPQDSGGGGGGVDPTAEVEGPVAAAVGQASPVAPVTVESLMEESIAPPPSPPPVVVKKLSRVRDRIRVSGGLGFTIWKKGVGFGGRR